MRVDDEILRLKQITGRWITRMRKTAGRYGSGYDGKGRIPAHARVDSHVVAAFLTV